MMRPEQTNFRRRFKYTIWIKDGGLRFPRAPVEGELDCWWTYAPEILDSKARGSTWRVEAFEGFGEAFAEEGPDDWRIEIEDKDVWPEWLVESYRKERSQTELEG